MWRFTPIEVQQSAKELRNVLDKVHPGGIPDFLWLLAKSPASLNAYLQAQDALARGELPAGQREQIALAVAEINGSDYCLALHKRSAREAGLNDAEIQLSRQASADDPKTRTMLQFVQAVVLQRGRISDGDFALMRKAGFSESEIIEILASVVLNIFANYFNLLAETNIDVSSPAGKPGASNAAAGVPRNPRRSRPPAQAISRS